MDDSVRTERAIEIFRQHGGTLRAREALRLGIHPRILYALRDSGVLQPLSRGLYRLSELPPLTNPDLVTVALQAPDAVVCLISALAFHELTTQVPHAVHIALSKGARRPCLDYPPLRLFWFSGPAFSEGIKTPVIDGTPVRIYNPEKTIADCFKLRHRLGLDIALEALKTYRRSPGFDPDRLLHYARICRVGTVVQPYLEALL